MKMWDEMMPHEKDATIHHRAFGKCVEYGPVPCPDKKLGCLVAHSGYSSEGVPVPHYTIDHAAARLVEDEIDRRGMQNEYIKALCAVIDPHYRLFIGMPEPKALEELMIDAVCVLGWALIRATPVQRCEAAWHALEEPSHGR